MDARDFDGEGGVDRGIIRHPFYLCRMVGWSLSAF